MIKASITDGEEKWQPIVGYPGYEVSDFGRVRSLKNGGRILAQTKNHKGYLRVKLTKNGISTQFLVHRLVGWAFNSGFRDGMQINHLNGDKSDNRPENLEWCTPSENLQHAYDVLNRKAAFQDKHMPDYIRIKISKSNKGRMISTEHRLRNSIAHRGKGIGGTNPKARMTFCWTTGEFFASVKTAATCKKLNYTSVYQACSKGYRANGLKFYFIGERKNA